MQRLQEFKLSTAEVLNAIEEYIRNASGTLSAKDTRAGCQLNAKTAGAPLKDCAATMSFTGEQ